jgi:CheY-like chemotaxis protein
LASTQLAVLAGPDVSQYLVTLLARHKIIANAYDFSNNLTCTPPATNQLIIVDCDVLSTFNERARKAWFAALSQAVTPLILLGRSSTQLRDSLERKATRAIQLQKPVLQRQLIATISQLLRIPRSEPSMTTQQINLSLPGLKVLVAEDNLVNRMVMKGLLAKYDIKPDFAGDGRKAVEAYKKALPEQPYDIIFMDCQMPVMDGYTATKLIRELEEGESRTPIIGVSAHALLEYRNKALTMGMDDYLTKPVRNIDLDAVFNTLLN